MSISVQSENGDYTVVIEPQAAHQITINRAGVQGGRGLQGLKGDKGEKGDKGDKGDTGAGGQVDSIMPGTGIAVDATDPIAPVVALDAGALASLDKADTAVQPSGLPPSPVNADWNATEGLAEILNKPTLFSGAYGDLSGKPALFSGAYGDLSGKPALFSGAYGDLSGLPTLGNVAAMDKASAANVRAAAANKVITSDGIENASALVTLIYGSTVAIDWDAFVIGDLTCTGNPTIGNPTNVQPGVSRSFFVFGDSATERSLSWGSNYADPLPEETVTSTSGLLITLTPKSAGLIAVSWQAVTP